MLRRLFTLASVLSLVVCVAIVALWVRSYWVADSWDWDRPGTRYSIGSAGGTIWWDRIRFTPAGQARFSRGPGYHGQRMGALPTNVVGPGWSFAGFNWVNSNMTLRPGLISILIQDLRIPDWAPVLATLLLPAAWLIVRRSRHLTASGLCSRCGYDLRATPERCPECGTPVTEALT